MKAVKGNRLQTVVALSFSPNGDKIACGNLKNTIVILDVQSGMEIRKFTNFSIIKYSIVITSVVFSHKGDKIVFSAKAKFGEYQYASYVSPIIVWDVNTGNELKRFVGHTDHVTAIVFFPNEEKIVSGSLDKTIRMWDINNKMQVKKFKNKKIIVKCVEFFPNGKMFATGSAKLWDESSPIAIKIWDIETGKEIQSLYGHKD